MRSFVSYSCLIGLLLANGVSGSPVAEWTIRDEGIATYEAPSDASGRLSGSSRIFLFCERSAPAPWPPTKKAQQLLDAIVSQLIRKEDGSLKWNESGDAIELKDELGRYAATVCISRNQESYPQVPFYIYVAVAERIQGDIAGFQIHIRFRDLKDFQDVKRILSTIKLELRRDSSER